MSALMSLRSTLLRRPLRRIRPGSVAPGLLLGLLVGAAACAPAAAPAPSPAPAGPPRVGAPASADAPPPIMRDFRAAWVASVANIDWPSRRGLSAFEQQAELVRILNRLVELNFNAVVLQVRPAGDALYASELEPWSEYLTGVQGRAPEPYYDPLEFAVREAHARGLELHAWFNPYRARHPSARGSEARTHLAVTRPELVRTYGNFLWMDPGEPDVRERTLAVMLDVVRRYDVDGIHMDDYFYPYPIPGPDSTDLPFPDSASWARYQRSGGTLARDDWRRANVDSLMRQVYLRTKAIKPWVKVGISPFGIWRPGHPEGIAGFDAYAKLYADARTWLREGWLDYFNPQLYWPIAQTAQSYPALLRWWLAENPKARHIWPGHNTSRAVRAWGPDEIPSQIRLTRELGATGDVHFSMRALMPPGDVRRDSVLVGVATPAPPADSAGLVAERLKAGVYAEPALIPESPWLARGARPARPTARLAVDSASGEHVLRLAPAGQSNPTWWTVRWFDGHAWKSRVLPGAQRSLAIGAAGAARPVRVVVTAVDRVGRESEVVEAR